MNRYKFEVGDLVLRKHSRPNRGIGLVVETLPRSFFFNERRWCKVYWFEEETRSAYMDEGVLVKLDIPNE